MSNLENQNIKHCTQCPDQCILTDLKCGKGRHYLERLQNGEAEHSSVENFEGHQGAHSKHRRDGEKKYKGRGHGSYRKYRRHKGNLEDRDELSELLRKCGHYLYHQNNKKRGQGRILKILAQSEEMTQKDLQGHLEIQSGSMSEIISKLENKGMVTRERDETDKRKIILRITKVGREKVERHLKEEKSKPLYESLSEEEQETLKVLLKKMLGNWHMKEK